MSGKGGALPLRTVALAGNPNVGKSTLFNALTGMNQHTGNWPGKTVSRAEGIAISRANRLRLVDLPGTYSLIARSPEEAVARDYLLSGEADLAVVVCDGGCLVRHLPLVLQVMERSARVVVCVNLLDEAARRDIHPNLTLLEGRLGVPVVGTVARQKKSLAALLAAIDRALAAPPPVRQAPVLYPPPIEEALSRLSLGFSGEGARVQALDALLFSNEGVPPDSSLSREREALAAAGYPPAACADAVARATAHRAATLADGVGSSGGYAPRDRRLDRLLCGRASAYPVMLLLLFFLFFLTIVVANYPSSWLTSLFSWLGVHLSGALTAIGTPPVLHSLLTDGVYLVLTRVVAVMLPPMAIFFPLFSILEDSGYLPRIAYNLDRPFAACHACGKQALTMCMGFGCHAAGVVGCRIIDSPRERLLATLTNAFVPCNGRFPALIALVGGFFVLLPEGPVATALTALGVTALVLLSVGVTFLATRLLSATLLRGEPSSFTLEMPPYRRPDWGRVLVRSLIDRTGRVLVRAVAVAAPAGAVIWLFANLSFGGATLLSHATAFFDPLGRLLGMDGVILFSFLLALPANEIVLPLICMAYLSSGAPVEMAGVGAMRELFLQNGWTWVTALCTAIFFLFHFPCSTALLTIRRETGKWRYVAIAALLPTLIGALLCLLIATGARLFGI